jgi:Phage tail tube protein, GTA-gp10
MSDTSHTAYFGDAEYTFKFTSELLFELERKTGAGIGQLCTRVFANAFTHTDLLETIRLSLVGGGVPPKRADELIATYAIGRPLIEIQPLATAILEARWLGKPKHEAARG